MYKGYILIKKYLHSHDSNSHRSLSDTHMQQHTYNSYMCMVYGGGAHKSREATNEMPGGPQPSIVCIASYNHTVYGDKIHGRSQGSVTVVAVLLLYTSYIRCCRNARRKQHWRIYRENMRHYIIKLNSLGWSSLKTFSSPKMLGLLHGMWTGRPSGHSTRDASRPPLIIYTAVHH